MVLPGWLTPRGSPIDIDTVRFAKWYLMLKEMKRIITPIKREHFMNVDSKEHNA